MERAATLAATERDRVLVVTKGLTVIDRSDKIRKAIDTLAARETLAGIPAEKTDRPAAGGMTNAALGYIHDNGAPEANIPARPWTEPGVKAVQGQINEILEKTGEAAFDGRQGDVERGMEAVGLLVSSSMRNVIDAGIAPALAESTLRKRAARGRKGAQQELANRAAGQAPSVDLAKPLLDTTQMRNSISYVVRKK